MTMNRFRIAAMALIGYNLLGTIITWAAHLQKPDIGAANAIAGGTQFTGPLFLVVLGIGALALTLFTRRRGARVGVVLLGLYGLGFAFGEISELSQHNVGISAGRWDVVLAGSVIGAIIGLTTAGLAVMELVSERRANQSARSASTVTRGTS
jgi:hypothetical protein